MNPAILLVDADSTNLKEWKSFLESQNCEVYTAEDSESAVSCCLQMQPDLVLLQDSLPEIRSFELCRRLKKDPLNQLTPVVLLKPAPDQWDMQRGHEAGAMDVWATPSTLWDALARIQTPWFKKDVVGHRDFSYVMKPAANSQFLKVFLLKADAFPQLLGICQEAL